MNTLSNMNNTEKMVTTFQYKCQFCFANTRINSRVFDCVFQVCQTLCRIKHTEDMMGDMLENNQSFDKQSSYQLFNSLHIID